MGKGLLGKRLYHSAAVLRIMSSPPPKPRHCHYNVPHCLLLYYWLGLSKSCYYLLVECRTTTLFSRRYYGHRVIQIIVLRGLGLLRCVSSYLCTPQHCQFHFVATYRYSGMSWPRPTTMKQEIMCYCMVSCHWTIASALSCASEFLLGIYLSMTGNNHLNVTLLQL